MLYTNLKHIDTADTLDNIIHNNENVIVIWGNMDPVCVPVFRAAEQLVKRFPNVKIYDMELENPESIVIRELSEVRHLSDFPFIVYYKNGKLQNVADCNKTYEQLKAFIINELSVQEHA